MLKRKIGMLVCLVMVLLCTLAMAESVNRENGVVVTCYQEMLDAVNEQKAELILISPKYKYKKETGDLWLRLEEGQTVTILPEQGEECVLNGYIRIIGGGTVRMEAISIVAPDGYSGLSVYSGARVSVGNVTAGKAKKGYGHSAVHVENAFLTIDSAIGSDGKNGVGGNGIYVCGSSVVEVHQAIGGNAPQGIGGTGVFVAGESEVTITGSATGGNGLYAPGKGVLAGYGSKQSGTGTITDGTLLEGKKTLDPSVISNDVMLINAIRNGETEIHLDPKFKCATGGEYAIDLIPFTDQPVRIIGNPNGRHPVLDCGLFALSGTWIVEGVDIKMTGKEDGYCVKTYRNASLTLTGSCSGTSGGIAYADGGKIEITGSAQCGSTRSVAVVAINDGSVRLNGDVTITKETNALYCKGGKIEVNGAVVGKANKDYPLIGIVAGSILVNGDVTGTGDANVVYVKDGNVEIQGSVVGKANKKYPVIWVGGGSLVIEKDVTGTGDANVVYVIGGNVKIGGSVYGKKNKDNPLIGTKGGETVINGSVSTSGCLIYSNGGTLLIHGDASAGKDNGYYPIFLDNKANQVTIEGNLLVDKWAASAKGGTLRIEKEIKYSRKSDDSPTKTQGGMIVVLHKGE